MAKKSVRYRNIKRLKMVNHYRTKRDKLREDMSNINLGDKERWEAALQLQGMPRDASPCRRRNRCRVCGRPRAYNRLTGLCRLHMRIAIISGMVPGMHKASW